MMRVDFSRLFCKRQRFPDTTGDLSPIHENQDTSEGMTTTAGAHSPGPLWNARAVCPGTTPSTSIPARTKNLVPGFKAHRSTSQLRFSPIHS